MVRAPSLGPDYLPPAPPLDTVTLKIKSSPYEILGLGHRYLVYNIQYSQNILILACNKCQNINEMLKFFLFEVSKSPLCIIH